MTSSEASDENYRVPSHIMDLDSAHNEIHGLQEVLRIWRAPRGRRARGGADLGVGATALAPPGRAAQDPNLAGQQDSREAAKPRFIALDKVLSLLMYYIAGTCIGEVTGFALRSVLAIGGVSGIAVGLAAKEIVGNFLGGALLFITRPFVIGDRVKAQSFAGWVEDIDFLHTRLIGYDQSPVLVPNSAIMNEVIVNYSRAKCRQLVAVLLLRNEDVLRVDKITDDSQPSPATHVVNPQQVGEPIGVLTRAQRAALGLSLPTSPSPPSPLPEHVSSDEPFIGAKSMPTSMLSDINGAFLEAVADLQQRCGPKLSKQSNRALQVSMAWLPFERWGIDFVGPISPPAQPERRNWETLKTAFIEEFRHQEPPEEIWRQLLELRQTSPNDYRSYEGKFSNLWERWCASLGKGERAPECLKKDCFLAELYPILRKKVKVKFPDTFEKAMAYVREKDRKLKFQAQLQEKMEPPPPAQPIARAVAETSATDQKSSQQELL
ncbi:hypothetical protein L7F22_057654 [Adiantum nelumboides]|nr:hypothetical protein [Adiantum nelumboides]